MAVCCYSRPWNTPGVDLCLLLAWLHDNQTLSCKYKQQTEHISFVVGQWCESLKDSWDVVLGHKMPCQREVGNWVYASQISWHEEEDSRGWHTRRGQLLCLWKFAPMKFSHYVGTLGWMNLQNPQAVQNTPAYEEEPGTFLYLILGENMNFWKA